MSSKAVMAMIWRPTCMAKEVAIKFRLAEIGKRDESLGVVILLIRFGSAPTIQQKLPMRDYVQTVTNFSNFIFSNDWRK